MDELFKLDWPKMVTTPQAWSLVFQYRDGNGWKEGWERNSVSPSKQWLTSTASLKATDMEIGPTRVVCKQKGFLFCFVRCMS